MLRQTLKNILPNLAYFYGYLKYRLILRVLVSFAVGLLDGLGLAMFLPLLKLIADSEPGSSEAEMGSLGSLVDAIESLGLQLNLEVILLSMLLFFTLKGAAKWLERYLTVIYQEYFTKRIRMQTINALSSYKYTSFVQADAGTIQNTLSGEVQRVVLAFKAYGFMLQQFVLLVTYAALAFAANVQFATLVLIGGILSNLMFQYLFKMTKVLSQITVESNNAFQGLLFQEVTNFKYLKASGRIKQYAQYLKKRVHEIEGYIRKIGSLDAVMQGAREPLMIGVIVAVILVQIKLLGGSLGVILLSLLFFYRSLGAVLVLQTQYNRFLSFSGSVKAMEAFIADLRNNAESKGDINFTGLHKSIKLQDLSFRYNPEKEILRGINLTIQKNETLALVGESGSGKTTLVNLISGLLNPTAGRILINDLPMEQWNRLSYQDHIGYITQEPVIFDDILFNNITFWDEPNEVNQERFLWALEQAQMGSFYEEQPEKEQTRLGNNGVALSGGQRQRISIARELYKNSEILLLDEATSALDSETEHVIQKNLKRLQGTRTMIIVAHRLSTIKDADRIVFMNEGTIVDVGTFEELAQRQPAFKNMVELQDFSGEAKKAD